MREIDPNEQLDEDVEEVSLHCGQSDLCFFHCLPFGFKQNIQ